MRNVRIHDENYATLRRLARISRRSLTGYINWVLAAHVAQRAAEGFPVVKVKERVEATR